MYVCLDCNEIFENPEIDSCPKCGNYEIEEVTKCEICNEYTLDMICESCMMKIENNYTTELGKIFLSQNNLEEDFYINYAACINNHDCDSFKLLEALKPDKYNRTPIVDFEEKLKEYCLDGYTGRFAIWIEFYNDLLC